MFSISQETIQGFMNWLVAIANNQLYPLMIFMMLGGVALRCFLYYTVSRNRWFTIEFEKRVHAYLYAKVPPIESSFYVMTKRLLEKTYYELFVIRDLMKRRKPDFVMLWSDRIFLIQHGTAWFVKETLKQIRHLRHSKEAPRLIDISRKLFQDNPCFSRLFGAMPVDKLTGLTNMLPGLFIVAGIFGTFIGIMNGLPRLSDMNLQDIEGSKKIMDQFLIYIAYSMSTSIIGIIMSVLMQLINNFLSPEDLFAEVVDRYENTLNLIWYKSENNEVTSAIPPFDEHKNPLVVLAEESVNKELIGDVKAKDLLNHTSEKMDDIVPPIKAA